MTTNLLANLKHLERLYRLKYETYTKAAQKRREAFKDSSSAYTRQILNRQIIESEQAAEQNRQTANELRELIRQAEQEQK